MKNKHRNKLKVRPKTHNSALTAKKVAPAVPHSPYKVSTSANMPSRTTISGPGLTALQDPPVVLIDPKAALKMDYLVAKCEDEVGWMCTVQKLSANAYFIDEVYLPEQTVSAVETDIDPDSLAAIYMEIMDKGEDPSRMYAWFHSHVDMGVSPSGQDEKQAEIFLQTLPVLIRGIMNKRGDRKVDVYLRDQGVAFTNVEVVVSHPVLSTEETNALDEEIKLKVIEQKAYGLDSSYGLGNWYTRNTPKTSSAPDALAYSRQAGHPNNVVYDSREDYTHESLVDYTMECDGCGTTFHESGLLSIPPHSKISGIHNHRDVTEYYCSDCAHYYAEPTKTAKTLVATNGC